ncbi:MAG: hypothetical protein V2A62_02565 [Candidatus Woesearchaeota archaeon]
MGRIQTLKKGLSTTTGKVALALSGLAAMGIVAYSTPHSKESEPENSAQHCASYYVYDNVQCVDFSLKAGPEEAKRHFGSLPFYQWLVDYGKEVGLTLEIKEGFFVLSNEDITKIGRVVGLESQELKEYLTTNPYRYLLYQDHRETPLTLDALLRVESSGKFNPQKPCNSKGYCGLMQLGYGGAFAETLQLLMSSSRKYFDFRNVNSANFAPEINLIDTQSEGLVKLIQMVQERVLKLKPIVNADIDACTVRGYVNEEESKRCESIGKFNRYLSNLTNYLNLAVRVHDPDSQRQAKKLYYEIISGRGNLFGSLNEMLRIVFHDQRDYHQLLSPGRIKSIFDKLWGKVKVNHPLNIAIAHIDTLFLDGEYDRLSEEFPQIYNGVDKDIFKYEAYNKGVSEVHNYLARKGKFPGNGDYPRKVEEAKRLFAEMNRSFYGDSNLSCNFVLGKIRCPLPSAIDGYLK